MVATEVIHLLAGHKSSGRPVMEAVPAEPLGEGRFRLLGSPGLAGGVAAGDEVELLDDGSVRVVRRSGNLALQLLADKFDDREVEALAARVEQIGGYLDGGHDRLRVFTVPVSAGFPAVEAVFNDYVSSHPGSEWYFGNVYGDDDVTPLGWWEG